jgi:two-component system phosphate regulon sensor histidine kinase PhoR
MSVSLIGIVGLQVYWITESIQVKEDQFSQLITQSLKSVSTDLETIDKVNFVERFKLYNNKLIKDNAEREQLLTGVNKDQKKSIVDKKKLVVDIDFSNIEFVVSQHDSLKQPVFTIKKNIEKEESNQLKSEFLNSLSASDSSSAFLLALLEQKYDELGNKMPIRKRVNKDVLEHLLSVSLSLNNIKTRFEYAIMSSGLITPVYSKRYRQTVNEYVVPIFSDNSGDSIYNLHVQFPEKRDYVLSTMWGMLLMSVIFTLVIVFTYAGALFLIFKHRRTSEVKTDFINNMTHELKTPIATINLSIDALSNPKILADKDKVLHYAKVIKEENKRMNQQIENVLRISRLGRNKLEMYKEEVGLNELVEDAINHILIIVEDRGGVIDFELDAENDIVNVDILHFGNILVNILDNANKYTIDTPEIKVKTYNKDNSVVVEITDNGMGINKAVQEKIFDKFFRVSKGNVHNIKGQGLGLAYVKQIVDAHDGTVTVKSRKGKGSTFIVTVPLK